MITPVEYHKLNLLSSSKIKVYRDNKNKFKKWLVDGVEPVQKSTPSTIIGDGVDFKLLREDENWDDFFVTYKSKKVTPMMLEYCNELYALTLDARDDIGKVNRDFRSLMEEAFNNVSYDQDTGEQIAFKKYKNGFNDAFIEVFNDKGKEYYETLRSVTGKKIITLQQFEVIEKLVNTLKSHWVTRELINLRSDKNREVINQFVFVFDYAGHSIKVMIDKMVINHLRKKIFIFDLKTCYNQDAFEDNFLKFGYYIQAALYTIAAILWGSEHFKEYEVVPLQFIICPTTFIEAPLFSPLSLQQLEKCRNGFPIGNRYYKGVETLLGEILWIKETGVWEMNKEDYENKGIRKIKVL